MQQVPSFMQRGFTLIELLVTMVVMAVAVSAVAFSIPSADVEHAEKEDARLLWTITEAHAVAMRHRITLLVTRLPQSNGYKVMNVPTSLSAEPWAQAHECHCSLSRLDTYNPAEPLRIEPDALLPHFKWRLDVGSITRTVESANDAP